MVVVLDDDVVKNINYPESTAIVTNWLVDQFEKLINSHQEKLPAKAIKAFYLHILWMCPPTHKFFGESGNQRRTKQSKCIESAVKNKPNMLSLKIIKSWDHKDSNAFIYDSYRFTSSGLNKYWLGVDAAIHFWNVAVSPKIGKNTKNSHNILKNRFKWQAKR